MYNYGDFAIVTIDPLDGALVTFIQNWLIEYVPSSVKVTQEEALGIAKASFNYSKMMKQGKKNLELSRRRGSSMLIPFKDKVVASLYYVVLNKESKQRDPNFKLPIKANLVWVVEYGGCAIFIDPINGKELEVSVVSFISV